MHLDSAVLQSFLAILVYIGPCQGATSCFKKFRRKSDTCGGLYKRKVFVSPDDCCSGQGKGFTLDDPVLFSRNKYACVSCADWNAETTTPSPVKVEFQCFRKFRDRQRTCGGPLKKRSPTTPEACCAGAGNGFYAGGLVAADQNKKNQYTCMSCEEWRNENLTTTEAPPTTTEAPYPEFWGQWGACSTSCGHGTRTRHRQCYNCDRYHHSNTQVRDCVVNFDCPIDGGWGEWAPWEHCSFSCGGGSRRRERKCDNPKPQYGGEACVGVDLREENCNANPCPVDGHWGQWSRFGRCSATCGLGTMVRRRECESPAPLHGGKECQGPRTNGRRCEQRKCPVHGGWSSWGEWSGCPVTCGTGSRTRSRECNSPRPYFGGRSCKGSATDHETCTVGGPCPVNGGWSPWTSYGTCRAAPCKRGHKLRSRVCNNPRPRNGGQLCRGRAVERMTCINTRECKTFGADLPVDGGWCEFGDWSSCSATCSSFSAVQTRARTCECPAPEGGGSPCTGDETEIRDCVGAKPCEQPVVDVDER